MKYANDYLAIRALMEQLQGVFDGEYADSYTRYHGVDIRMKTDEDTEPENIGKPLVLLDQSGGDRSDWSSARAEARQVTLDATTFATDFSGATQGAANPVTSDEQLSRDMVQEFEGNRIAWDTLGIYDVQIAPQSVNRPDKTVARKIEHRLTFHYFLG